MASDEDFDINTCETETTVRRTRTTRNVARRGRGRKKTAVNPPRSTRSKRSKKGDSDDDDDDVQEIETQAASDVENSDTVEQEVSNTDGEDLASPEEEINETNPVKNGLQEVEFVENALVSKDTHNTKKDAEEESLEDSNDEDVDKVIVEIINPDDVKPTDSDKDRSLIQTSSDLANRESVESCSEDEQTEAVVVTQVPELEEAPPPSVNKLLPSPSIVSNLRQKSVEADINQTNTSHDSGDEGQSDGHCQNKQEEEEEVGNANMDDMTVIDEVMEEGDEKDDSGATAKSELKKEGEMEEDFPTEPDTEMVSEDELPTETAKEQLDTELVSDEELPDPATTADLPETEAVSEDELPPEKTDKKKKTASKSSDIKGFKFLTDIDILSEGVADSTTKSKKKSEAQKRKLAEGDTYDPSSPTSENSCDESPAAKRAAVSSGGSDVKSKPVKARKALPELDKYWKAVKEDSSDFTGWTYLLQYVDQENDLEAAREAYDAFLSHYPYCYGYWRKYADYEKRKGNKEKCEEVFERGLKAIPLSVDLWIHYLNYCKAAYADNEDHLRTQFEKAISACGMEFRSDRLWESFIKWETEGKRLQNITAIYDRLLATPTQGYTNHFDNFQEHISNNPPQKVLSVDEFLTQRREVLQLLKQYDTEEAAPGEDVDAPPGEEPEEQPSSKTDEETTALRERIISLRRKIHKATTTAVADRWNFEEGIKRPYFHVKPLERCQLKNWKEYLDFEIEHGDHDRVLILFERCLIACALYEEFWIKFVHYLESKTGMDDNIRDVYERACTIHHPKKPSLHLHWAVYEESHKNYDKASDILTNLEKVVPNMLQVAYRLINLERRRGNFEKVCELYEHYITNSKNKVIANNLAIKYARFNWKVKGDIETSVSILNKAVEKDKDNPRLYLQLIDMGLQRVPLDETEIISIIDKFLIGDADPEQKLLFAQRKVEFLEDFGSDILSVQKAHDEFQRFCKNAKDRKKKLMEAESKPVVETPSKKSKGSTSGNDSGAHTGSHTAVTPSQQPPQPQSGTQPSTAAGQYPPPNYQGSSSGSSYTQSSTQGGYQGQYPQSTGTQQQPPAPYNQAQYNQQYSQSGDPNYANYQNWGYSQTGYGGYNQGWGNYNYY